METNAKDERDLKDLSNPKTVLDRIREVTKEIAGLDLFREHAKFMRLSKKLEVYQYLYEKVIRINQ